jgi:hypothetical protein
MSGELKRTPFELDPHGEASPLLDQLRFAEALMADPDLNETERRVGFLIARWFRHGDGCTVVGLEKIAAALTVSRRAAIYAIEGLERKDWLRIDRGGGRGIANVYIPNGERVQTASPFSEAVKRVQTAAQKCASGSTKGCKPTSETVQAVATL